MATLTLYLEMVGTEPGVYYETLKGYGNYRNVISEVRTRSVAAGAAPFCQQLAKNLRVLFDLTLKSGPPGFKALNTSSTADRTMLDTDLLCYICETRQLSILRRFDPTRFASFLAQSPKAAGSTANMVRNNMVVGIMSEIYLDRIATDITAATFAVYHEWMHNKTNWTAGEDPNWVHRLVGGGLSEENDDGLKGLTPISAQQMNQRLTLRNRQFLDGVPIR
ncbi:MAG: hypothetical protein JWP04_3389 [Belnapia sp.]|nr:hypothetical protein [Belnapia sp.]